MWIKYLYLVTEFFIQIKKMFKSYFRKNIETEKR